MKYLKRFKTIEEYLSEKSNLPYYCLSFIDNSKIIEVLPSTWKAEAIKN